MTDDESFTQNVPGITCADAVELVTGYLDEALSPAELDGFQRHLGFCNACPVFVEQIRTTVRLVAETADQSVEVLPANFDELLAALEHQAE